MNLEPLLEYLDSTNADAARGLTRQKVERRGEKFATNNQGVITFEMDRHHPVGGSQYFPGAEMSALITQRYRYSFNPIEKDISDEPIGRPTWDDQDWNWEGLAEENLFDTSFDIVEIEHGRYQVRESCTNFTNIITSVDEAKTAFRKEVSRWNFAQSFEDIGGIKADTKALLCHRLQKECCKLADSMIEDAWKNRELLE